VTHSTSRRDRHFAYSRPSSMAPVIVTFAIALLPFASLVGSVPLSPRLLATDHAAGAERRIVTPAVHIKPSSTLDPVRATIVCKPHT
jgi:hypothetical protein